jgi:antagonist of KipI
VRIREAGDSMVLLEVVDGPTGKRNIDAGVNIRAIQIAGRVRQRRIPGVRDVVPTFRSVAVFFDPLATDIAAVQTALQESQDDRELEEPGRLVEIPVIYGGDEGPDLEHVAASAGLTPEAVIELHASPPYRVFMLGFLPGFPYMASVDQRIAVPRRDTPRMRVPRGSVGIAGLQTGVYPRESPGGWQIIGRTSLHLFDATNSPPALLAPGDTVQFVPVSSAGDAYVGRGFTPRLGSSIADAQAAREGPLYDSSAVPPAARFITVLRPGLLTTIQDCGRWGYQHLGVPVSGPMDPSAHRLANALLGNAPDAATLEATILGPELRFEQAARITITGGDLQPALDGRPLTRNTVVQCAPGSLLQFGDRRSGVRAYVAVDGGIAVPQVLGSRATHVMSGLGGIRGRVLGAGDQIPLGPDAGSGGANPWGSRGEPDPGGPVAPARPGGAARPTHMTTGDARLRVMPGPQVDYVHPSALEVLQRSRFTVSPQSDRMGYRLTGSALPMTEESRDMISDATVVGAVQVPPSGQPILLMADRQTTGGYPQIAVVITADLALAGQLGPGDSVRFELCSRAEAIAALSEQEGFLRGG